MVIQLPVSVLYGTMYVTNVVTAPHPPPPPPPRILIVLRWPMSYLTRVSPTLRWSNYEDKGVSFKTLKITRTSQISLCVCVCVCACTFVCVCVCVCTLIVGDVYNGTAGRCVA